MTYSTPRQVHVRVPATTANLGSGFDVLGLALQLYNSFTLSLTPTPGWQVSLPAGITLPRNDDNLFYRAASRLFARLGKRPSGLRLSASIDIPLARGLGSSSTAIVGGLVAANQLLGNPLTRDELLTMAVDIEGHPDNVTPALMGGLTLSYAVDGEYHYVPLMFPAELRLIVAVPDFELPTSSARAVLPERVSRADAVYNCSRIALLIHVLQHRRYDLLAIAMEDRLHQPYRASLIPGMADALAAGCHAGAHGMALSGAGPTLLALVTEDEGAVAAALSNAFARHGVTCRTLVLQADKAGAVVVQTEG